MWPFFIVMPMKSEEIGIAMVLPGKSKQDTTVKVKQSNVATIRVLASNAITVDHQPVTLRTLKAVVEERIQSNDKTVVILETHPDADYGMMIACLDEVKLSGARKFSLKTTKR
jgi:biopolymer transport protein ExbD